MSDFSESKRTAISERAGFRCEYCHLPTRGQVATFPIDHVLPKSAGGTNDSDNLALSCPHCNAHKWIDTAGIDPDTGQPVPFFNPRKDTWDEHFVWSRFGDGILAGRTPCGRATIIGLRINDPDMVALRQLLRGANLFEYSESDS